MSGRFVVLEGGEGAGKSTQVRRLADRLRRVGLVVVATLEPGGTEVGRRIRAVLLDGSDHIAPVAEALLMAADRAQHVREVVAPALARGDWVVSDRYVPSSLAYQGIARGLGVEAVEAANRWATDDLDADLVVVLDLPDAAVDGRQSAVPDRMERAGDGFHARVRAAYRELAAKRGWPLVDAGAPPDEVEAAIWAVVEARLGPVAP